MKSGKMPGLAQQYREGKVKRGRKTIVDVNVQI